MGNALVTVAEKFRPQQVMLIRRMNKDCDEVEFDQFMHVAANLGLDPTRKQIYAFVFNKDNAARRQMAIVIGIDGFRAVAARSGSYRPDEEEPDIQYSDDVKNPDTNPLGIVRAKVRVWRKSGADWFSHVGVAYWDEYAPIVEAADDEDAYEYVDTGEFWEDSGKPKKRKRLKPGFEKRAMLDPQKPGWRKMARIMIGKCAEAQAIRRGWPEDLSGVYADDELAKAHSHDIELTATEIVEKEAVQNRLLKIAGKDAIMFDMGDGLEQVPLDKAGDMLMERFEKMQPHEILQWENTNTLPMREFWARSKTDALEIKKFIEGVKRKLAAEEVKA